MDRKPYKWLINHENATGDKWWTYRDLLDRYIKFRFSDCTIFSDWVIKPGFITRIINGSTTMSEFGEYIEKYTDKKIIRVDMENKDEAFSIRRINSHTSSDHIYLLQGIEKHIDQPDRVEEEVYNMIYELSVLYIHE